jgi:hypothetical protein
MTPSAIKLRVPFGTLEAMPTIAASVQDEPHPAVPAQSSDTATSPTSPASSHSSQPDEPLIKPGKDW